MKKEDMPYVLKIERQSFKDPWTEGMFEKEVGSDFYVVKRGENIVGYGGFIAVFEEADLINIAVSPLFRRKKIGSYLLNFLIKKAKEKGVEEIKLEVRESNKIAQMFYKKHGFLEIGKRKGYYKDEDAIVMACVLK
ncbi:TPA: ribosomal-protein-alanine N-acetyltransferase [bacterium]|nr:ribosomal-protein-alanine N-acetyltransferase [bacterium]